ncbi:hypothetical protein, partial [Streptosporangium sp. NPDC023615]|uniref:hypothetical protein n=1 Tax=Streptosporangium sp. NPDC023615 TaxID=3154794 RepID=UPI00341D20AB
MPPSPLARRLLDLITGTAKDPTYWPVTSRLSAALGTRVRIGEDLASIRYVLDGQARRWVVDPARELVEFLLRDEERSVGPFDALVAAELAGMDAEVSVWLAGWCAPITLAEAAVPLGWDVERRALFAEAVRQEPHHVVPPPSGVTEWLGGLPGYPDFARTALEAAEARVAAIHAGEIPYAAEKAFENEERATVGRAVRLALLRDEPWLPELLESLVRGIAVAPTTARTLPSQALLFEIARAVEEHPTPEAVSALRAACRVTRHAGVPGQLDRMFKRIEPALADRLEVAFRL